MDGAAAPRAADADADADALPAVVRRALGDLEGFLLPRYLSLRLGPGRRRGGAPAAALLPPGLRRAEAEARRARARTAAPGGGRPRGPSGDFPAEARRGGPGAAAPAATDAAPAAPGRRRDAEPGDDDPSRGGGRRRKRTRRRRRHRRSGARDDEDLRDDDDDDDDGARRHYRTMARIVVAPYTPSLVALVDRCKKAEAQQRESACVNTTSKAYV